MPHTVAAAVLVNVGLASLVIALPAGWLARWDGASWPAAITRGAVAFGGSVLLGIAILNAMGLPTIIVLLISLVIALPAGWLARWDGASWPAAITRGAVAFCGSAVLGLAVVSALGLVGGLPGSV